MNDRYLFKAKGIDWRELPEEDWWVVGYYFCMRHNDERTHIHHFLMPLDTDLSKDKKIEEIQVEVDESTLCRCTGLKDKNGNLIWENDICKYYNPEDGDGIAVIKEDYATWIKGTSKNDIITPLFYLRCSEEWEVKGNIFDNPKLLEVE